MDRGTYIAASAGMAQLRKLEVVTNNLANISTAGFKKEGLKRGVQSFDDTLAQAAQIENRDPFARGDHLRAPGTKDVSSYTDFTQGSIKNTGNPLDVAVRNEKHFFGVQTPTGIEYTKAGNFTLNSEGILVTQDGMPVVAGGGTIQIEGGTPSILQDGSVLVDGNVAGNISVFQIENLEQLKRGGPARFIDSGGAGAQEVEADVIPESLEMANVSAISSVIDLISAQRGFSLYTKSAETIDTLNQTAINQIGRRTN